MDAISRPRHRGPTIAVLAGLVIGALLAPVTALAVEDDGVQILPEPIEFPEATIIDDTQGERPDPATPAAASCDDLLAVASPDRTTGNNEAVAITAQSIDADITGWSNVAWEPAPGTTLRKVIVTGTDGTLTHLTDGTDNATDVATLTFCGTATPPAATVASCDDLLAVVSPEGTEGDDLAVAITAQSIDADITGWSNVAWEPAPGTTLRKVIVTGTDGTLTHLTDGTDNATDVATLTFCGTVDRPANEDPKPSAPTTPAPTGTAPTTPGPSTEVPTPTDIAPTTSPSTGTSPSPTPSPSTGTTTSTGTATTGTDRSAPPRADPDDQTEPDVPGVTVVEPLEAPNEADDDTRADATDDAEPVEDVEVLGVQLTREDGTGGDGRFGGWVAMLAVVALLAAAGGVMWSRRS